MKKTGWNCSMGAIALVMMAPALAHAAEDAPGGAEPPVAGITDIIVTAQKTTSTIQKTPISIAVVTGQQISALAQTGADGALQNVAGVEVQGAARGFVISIRGLGTDTPPGVGESSVSTNFDGVYSIRAEANTIGFYDLDRVEVLRGPQSTLYGRNATGGVVNMISANPKLGETSGSANIGVGNYSLFRGEAALNVPIGETLALRVSGTGISRDGYLSNGHNDQKGAGVRAKLLWKPTEDLSVLAGYESAWIKGKGQGAVESANFTTGDYYTTADPGIGGQNYHGYKVWSQIDWKVGPGTLTIIPAYQHGSGTNRGYFGGRGAYGYDPKNIEQDSGEVRYAADPASPVKWIVGLYHYEYSQYTFSEANAEYGSQAGFSRNRGISNAVFGQVTVPVTDSLRLIGGVRQSWDKRRARGTDVFGNIVGGKIKGDFFDYRAGLEADLSPTSLAYFTASSAFRPGGVNAFDGSPFKPERLHSYEAGIKNRFLDNRLQINASGFYYDYKDYQVVDFFIGAAGPNLVFYNVDATNYGLELDAQAALTVDDTVNVSVSYLHSKIDGDLILHPADPFTAVNFKGERLPHAPAWTVKGGYQHVFDLDTSGSVTARVDGRYVSKQFVAPNNTSAALQKGYATADASISWESADKLYGFTVFARNIADKAVKTGYFVGYNTVGAPRTYGATARVSF